MTTPRDLAERLGLKRSGRSWRGNCPACGYVGAFSLREGRAGRPLVWCASCSDRSALLAIVATGDVRGLPTPDLDRERAARAKATERALALWAGSEPVAGTPVEYYLNRRCLSFLIGCSALRFRGDCPHPERSRLPAMIAIVTDPTGGPVAIHRTYLRTDGRKADIEPVKATLGPVWGAAIRLSAPLQDAPLIVAEGVETAAAAGRLLGMPAWAALSAGNLGKGLALPASVRRVIIAADPDEPGRKAARDAWTRWRAEGRDATIAMPDGPGDFADLLMAREAAPDA